MSEFGVEEVDWPAQSPDLNLIERFQDELEETASQALSVSDLTSPLLEELSKILVNTQPFQKS